MYRDWGWKILLAFEKYTKVGKKLLKNLFNIEELMEINLRNFVDNNIYLHFFNIKAIWEGGSNTFFLQKLTLALI